MGFDLWKNLEEVQEFFTKETDYYDKKAVEYFREHSVIVKLEIVDPSTFVEGYGGKWAGSKFMETGGIDDPFDIAWRLFEKCEVVYSSTFKKTTNEEIEKCGLHVLERIPFNKKE